MRLDLELHQYKDGTLRLYYEDRLEGRDATFLLNPDGTADEVTSEPGPDGPDDYDGWVDTFTRINLYDALRALAARVQQQRDA